MINVLSEGALYFSFLGVVILLGAVQAAFVYRPEAQGSQTRVLRDGGFLDNYLGREKLFLMVGQLIFAGFVVGTKGQWLLFPISFLLAIPLYRYLILPASATVPLLYQAARIRAQMHSLIENIARSMAVEHLQKRLDTLLVNLSSGKLAPSEYEKATQEIRKEQESLQTGDETIAGVPARDVVFAIGPHEGPGKNAFLAARWGLLLLVPLIVLYLLVNLRSEVNPNQPFYWLSLALQLSIFIGRYLFISTFYGAYFEYIRGDNGLKKALFLSAFIAATLLPYQVFSLGANRNALFSFVLEVGQIAYFLIGLGLAFTWETLRRNGFPAKHLRIVISDVPSLVTAGSLVVTTIGVIITSLLQGQLTTILTTVMRVVLPTLSLPPPGG
jgi:hypothetical protein